MNARNTANTSFAKKTNNDDNTYIFAKMTKSAKRMIDNFREVLVNTFNKSLALSMSAIAMALSSCAVTRAEYVPVQKIATQPKPAESVEYLVIKPTRAAIGLGLISVNGNGHSNFKHVIEKAKKKAAEMGGDFILQEKAGSETKTVVNPGYSTYQSNGNAFVSGGRTSVYGSANQRASGYSVGPSISTFELPWAVYSVWIYRPSQSGIDFDDNDVVTGFRLNSDAVTAGIKIGDKLLGIDGLDVKDESLSQHIMTVQPGDKMVYSMLRDGNRLDFTVTALPN